MLESLSNMSAEIIALYQIPLLTAAIIILNKEVALSLQVVGFLSMLLTCVVGGGNRTCGRRKSRQTLKFLLKI